MDRRALLAAALLLLGWCSAPVHAQTWTSLFNCPVKPAVPPSAGVPGGISCRNVTDQAVTIGAWAVKQLDSKATLLSVLNYAIQTVAGFNHFETLVYLSGDRVTKVTQVKVYEDLSQKRSLISRKDVPTPALSPAASKNAAVSPLFTCGAPGTPGGLSCAARVDDAAKDNAKFALLGINSQKGFTYGPATFIRVFKPYATQVVAGMNYFTTMAVSTTDGIAVVQSSVYRDLSNKRTLTKWQLLSSPPAPTTPPAKPLPSMSPFSCSPPGSPPLAGGIACKAVDSTANQVAAFALGKVNQANALPNGPLKLSAIAKYATQVVAGTNYFLELSVVNTKGAASKVQVKVFEPLPFAGGAAARELTGFVKV